VSITKVTKGLLRNRLTSAIRLRNSRSSLTVALCGALSLAAGAASVQATDVGPARDLPAQTQNPYSPQYGHPYRGGAVPTLDGLEQMKAWAAAHPLPATESMASVAGATIDPNNVMTYGGGTNGVGVMSGQMKVYLVFWGNQWGTQSTDANNDMKFTGDPKSVASAVQEMFKGIGTNNETWQAALGQWCDGPNVAQGVSNCPSDANFVPYQTNLLAGVWYDKTAAAPSQATEQQLGDEANAAAAYFHNTTPASNRYTYYVILSPTGTNPDNYLNSPPSSPDSKPFCAWHSTVSLVGSNTTYGDLAFSNQPYNTDSSVCGANYITAGSTGALDGYTMTLGHEWQETMSDVAVNTGWGHPNWSGRGFTAPYGENGDICAWIPAGQTGGAAYVAFSTGSFAQQAAWSNDTNSCAMTHAILTHTGGGTPTANFSVATNGLTATFIDNSTDSGGTISAHSWTFGDGSTSTATSPSHTYAAAGTYNVTETVTDSVSGATNAKTISVTVTAPSTGGTPTAAFSVSTNGLTATFTDSSTDTGGTISAHSWTFGDGSTSTATSPSHTYASAGTYSVTETVTDSANGKTSSATKSVTVAGGGVWTGSVNNLSQMSGGYLYYSVTVPAGATNLKFVTSGGSGIDWLFVGYGYQPSLYFASYSSENFGTSQSITIANPTAGSYGISLWALTTFSGVNLTVTYNQP
jgi:serine protease